MSGMDYMHRGLAVRIMAIMRCPKAPDAERPAEGSPKPLPARGGEWPTEKVYNNPLVTGVG